jgi:hypothetical protein
MTETTIEGMVDDLGRPATIYTPPEVLRRDPSRWPTPEEFVAEWERYTPEQRTALAERILRDSQEVEPLRRKLDEAHDRLAAAQALPDKWEREADEIRQSEGEERDGPSAGMVGIAHGRHKSAGDLRAVLGVQS